MPKQMGSGLASSFAGPWGPNWAFPQKGVPGHSAGGPGVQAAWKSGRLAMASQSAKPEGGGKLEELDPRSPGPGR